MALTELEYARRALSFSDFAAAYAAHRPSYPPALFEAVEELAGRPLPGARVVDVGAGTGIASALLLRRGARVVAVEPGEGMARELRRGLPAVPVLRGDGNALPLTDACADLVTYAQSWHWTAPERAFPEAMRVLRPGGSLALWWNVADPSVGWVAEQGERIRRRFGVGTGAHGTVDENSSGVEGTSWVRRRIHWTRTVSLDAHLANLATHSLFLVQSPGETESFLAREREALGEVFADGQVVEAYHVDLLVSRRD